MCDENEIYQSFIDLILLINNIKTKIPEDTQGKIENALYTINNVLITSDKN